MPEEVAVVDGVQVAVSWIPCQGEDGGDVTFHVASGSVRLTPLQEVEAFRKAVIANEVRKLRIAAMTDCGRARASFCSPWDPKPFA